MAADIGVYGLGTMGSALTLNLAESGVRVAVSNRETDWIAPFLERAGPLASHVEGAETLEGWVAALSLPRVLLFMIPSGAPMDVMLEAVVPLLAPGDIVIDGGNADFNDTRRRAAALEARGVEFVGMGVSGGEDGARSGPSLMVGSSVAAWSSVQPLLEAIAARFGGDACVARVGPDGAGHFVKTVHNGIEYADMEMISEVYGLLRDGAEWPAGRIGALFERWTGGPLQSFLLEVSARALAATDPKTGQAMVDVILDQAGQKGTGRWTVIEALKLGQSASTIEAAVGARGWSSEKAAREVGEEKLVRGRTPGDMPSAEDLERALQAGRILAHAQGFRVLAEASEAFDWSLDLARIAEIWRAGCIIRSSLLEELVPVLRARLPQDHLILSPVMRVRLAETVPALRKVVIAALHKGLAVPSLSAGLAWYDTMARARGTANLVQAQRDIFGRHGFQRVDAEGAFNGTW